MWKVSPCRRVLIENCAFYYAFGNTNNVSLYRENNEEENKVRSRWLAVPMKCLIAGSPLTCAPSAQLLLLGFGDVRNVLATASNCAMHGKRACRTLSFELCDHSLACIARGLLLLHLAGTIDPSSLEDLDFLWGVWYCLALSDAHAARLAATVRELLQRSAECGPRAALADAAQAAAVESALRGWLQPTPGAQALRTERRVLQASRISMRCGSHVGPAELQEYYASHAMQALSGLLPPFGGAVSTNKACCCALYFLRQFFCQGPAHTPLLPP